MAGACANHHRARIDADPHSQLHVPRQFVELRDGVENRQARARRALRVVVVRRRPAEVRHQAVAQVLRDVPLVAGDRRRRRTMKAGQALPPFLRVNLRRDPRRAHQVAEQHRQMPPLPGQGLALLAGRGAVQRRSALGTEPGLRKIFETAFEASPAERSPALVTEARACGVVGCTIRTAHRPALSLRDDFLLSTRAENKHSLGCSDSAVDYEDRTGHEARLILREAYCAVGDNPQASPNGESASNRRGGPYL